MNKSTIALFQSLDRESMAFFVVLSDYAWTGIQDDVFEQDPAQWLVTRGAQITSEADNPVAFSCAGNSGSWTHIVPSWEVPRRDFDIALNPPVGSRLCRTIGISSLNECRTLCIYERQNQPVCFPLLTSPVNPFPSPSL
jgi:hypothetical protein